MNKVEKKMVEKIESDIKWWLNQDAYPDHIEKEKRLLWLERDYREIKGGLNMLLWLMLDSFDFDENRFDGSKKEEMYDYLNNKAFKAYRDTRNYIVDNR